MKNAQYVDETSLLTEFPPMVPFSPKPIPFGSEEEQTQSWLPDASVLRDLVDLKRPSPVPALLDSALLHPARELVSNRGKRVRAKLVRLGSKLIENPYRPAADRSEPWRICAEAIEFLHAGSLAIDDIEDGSSIRRRRPALHVRYGMPLALNTANWLYFWPLEMLRRLGLPVLDQQLIYELYHRSLLRAHFGQALDLGTRIDTIPKDQIEEVCFVSMRLKTGALTGLAFSLGAIVGGVRGKAVTILDRFGCRFGIALQMFDDLGNVAGNCEPSKKYEDLMLYRPSWIWASAARHASNRDFNAFVAAVRALPDATELDEWFYRHEIIGKARQRARDFVESAFHSLRFKLRRVGLRCSGPVLEELRRLGAGVSNAYG